MRKALKAELWKAFHDPMLLLTALCCLLIVAANVWNCAAEMADWARSSRPPEGAAPDIRYSTEGYSLFVLSLPYYPQLFSAHVFNYIWPLLAAIPYGTSYMQERRTGVFNQVVSRIGRKKYFFAKYIAVFVTGGVAVSLTELTAVLADAMVVPYWRVHISLMETLHNGAFLSTLYYTHPWLHLLCWCGALFLIGGSTACLTFFAWTGLRLRALTVVIPFAIYFVTGTVIGRLIASGLIPRSSLLSKVANVLFVVQVGHSSYPGLWSLAVAGVVTAVTLIAGYIQVVKNELD